MKFSLFPIILALAAEVVDADFFRNDFLPVSHVRTDAIINPDCLSDHVHTFYGPPLVYPALTFDDLRNSDPSLSSGNIEENNSLYWHPAVYHVANNGKKTLQESGIYHARETPELRNNQPLSSIRNNHPHTPMYIYTSSKQK